MDAPPKSEIPWVLLDLNTADRELLMTLPGIGPSLADRLIAARPFASLEDIQSVRGIGPALFNRLKSIVTVEPPSETEEVEDTALEEEREAEIQAGVPPEETVTQPKFRPAPSTPKPVTRSEVLWIGLGSGLLSLLVSLIIIFGLLLGLNRGLRYVSPSMLNSLQRQVASVQNQTELLQQDLSLLRSRMDGLEGIGQRIDTLDQQMTEMQTSLQSASDRADSLSRQVIQMSRQMDTLQAQSDRFEGFLTGLRNLVIALYPGDTNR